MQRHSVAAIAAILLAWAMCASCGSDEAEPITEAVPATTADLVGPWRPVPLVIDAGLWQRLEAACIRDMQIPRGAKAVLVDIRGAEVATVLLAGASPGACDALRIAPTGEIEGAGGGRWGGPGIAEPGGGQLSRAEQYIIGGGELRVRGWGVSGRAGAGIKTVSVQVAGCPEAFASIVNGWFAAWCPIQAEVEQLEAMARPPVVVRAFDAFGNLLDEQTF